jgi:very-short-patch-repair endonuclease
MSRAHRDPKLRQLLAVRASAMRHSGTWSEQHLFRQLSRSALGVRFIRQAPVGRFVVDLLAPAVGLAVEVDGGWHRRRTAADARRDEKLRRLGIRVLRIPAELVERDVAQAVELVRRALGAPG